MKISIRQLKELYDAYGSEVHLKFLRDGRVQHYRVLAGENVLPEHVDLLSRTRLQFIEVLYEPVSYQYLNRLFPTEFREHYGSMSYMDFDRYLEVLERANLASHKKRYAIVVGDIYGVDSGGNKIPLLSHDDMLDYKQWNTVKRNIDKKTQIKYRLSETAIIVLVNLNMDADSEYVERFKKNTDLISILVSNKNEYADTISRDFIPTEDVYSVTDPGELLDTYIKSDARLIIIGEEINDVYKKALIEVKKHDKFVRMMVVPEINQSNIDHFLKEVALVYNADRWDF